jgi:type I restriction enzyme, S subunit
MMVENGSMIVPSRKKLPAGWCWVKLGEIASLINGRAYSADELLEYGKFPVLRVGNLFTSDHWYYSDLELDAEKYCDKGDLLYAWSASFGSFIWSGPKVIFHYHIWKVVCKDNLHPEYALSALNFITDSIKSKSHGLGMLHMTKNGMEQFEIPLPPLPEQRRIAALLKEQMAAVDKARAAAEERLAAIKALPAAFLRQVFPQQDQLLPDAWRLVKTGEICILKTGGTPSKSDLSNFGGDIKWLLSGDINQGEIFDCKGRISQMGLINSNATLLPADCVLIALNGQGKTRGSVALLCVEATCNQSLVAFIPIERSTLLPRFLLYQLQMRYQEIRNLTGDNHRSGLSLNILNNLDIILPDYSEQHRIAAQLKEKFAAVEKARKAAEAELETINSLPASLLRRAFNGEL